jgi:hypothetical protein
MSASQEMQKLVDTYFPQIEVTYTDFDPWHKVGDGNSDAAVLRITVPKEMLDKYSSMTGLQKGLPNGVEFWKETKLAERLREYKGRISGEHAPLLDILDFLRRSVQVDYSGPFDSKVDISICEI